MILPSEILKDLSDSNSGSEPVPYAVIEQDCSLDFVIHVCNDLYDAGH